MNQEQKSKIVEAIKTYCEATHTSQNKLATKIGKISNATISQMINGNWDLIKDDMWNKVAIFLNIQDNEWNIVKSRNYSLITNACFDTQYENSRMIGIPAYTGAGKTTALKLYAQNNKHVYYMLCNALMNKKDFCSALQKSLGIEKEGRISERMQAIIDEIKTKSSPLVIIDDYGKLPDTVMRMLQILYDETEGYCGIVIAGTEYMKNYIDKMASKDKMGFREMKSRVKYWLQLTKPSASILKQICEANGLTKEEYIMYVVTHSTDFRQANAIIINIKKLIAKGEQNVLDNLTIGYKH